MYIYALNEMERDIIEVDHWPGKIGKKLKLKPCDMTINVTIAS